MNMNAVDLLLLFSDTPNIPAPPPIDEFWIDNLGNNIVTNTGDKIIFNVGV